MHCKTRPALAGLTICVFFQRDCGNEDAFTGNAIRPAVQHFEIRN